MAIQVTRNISEIENRIDYFKELTKNLSDGSKMAKEISKLLAKSKKCKKQKDLDTLTESINSKTRELRNNMTEYQFYNPKNSYLDDLRLVLDEPLVEVWISRDFPGSPGTPENFVRARAQGRNYIFPGIKWGVSKNKEAMQKLLSHDRNTKLTSIKIEESKFLSYPQFQGNYFEFLKIFLEN